MSTLVTGMTSLFRIGVARKQWKRLVVDAGQRRQVQRYPQHPVPNRESATQPQSGRVLPIIGTIAGAISGKAP